MADLTPEQKVELITRGLQEVLKPEIINDIVVKEQRPLAVYWGTATTGRPHCGYWVPMIKLAHFLRAGCKVKVLLADIHGFLDNLKAPIELVNYRAQYYRFMIESMLRAVGVSTDQLEFVLGSSYQLSSKYTMDLFRLSSLVSENDAKRAGAEVVKQSDNAPLSGLIYPLMQALDEEHLGVDAQFGGVDQRKIFILAAEQLGRVGYKERAHLMNPMIPGLAGGKMSASDPDSKIDILETAEGIKKKIRKAYAVPKETDGNGMVSFVEYVVLPFTELKEGKAKFVCERREGEGEPLVYDTIDQVKEDYVADKLTPQLLKGGVSAFLTTILAQIQEDFQGNKEWQEIEKKAYPPPPAADKKKKKPKDKGSKHPGAAKVQAQPDGTVEGADKEKVSVGESTAEALEKLDVKE